MKKLMWLLFLPVAVFAQVNNPSVRYVAVAPSGPCAQAPPVQVANGTGVLYTCNNGTWASQAGEATGPGGSTGQLQWNDLGDFDGTSGGTTDGTHFAFGPSSVINDPQYSSPGILTIENVSPDTSITGLSGINSNILWSPSGSVTEGAFAANTLNVTTDFDNALSIAVNPSSALSVGMTDTTTGSTAGAYITAANYQTTVGNASGTEVDGIVGGLGVGTGTWTDITGVNWTVELNGTTAGYAAGSTFFGTVAGASSVGTVAGFAAGDFSINDTATVPNVASAWLIANPIASPNVTNNIGLYIDGVFNGDWAGGANNYAILSTSTALSQFDGLIQSPALIETAAAPTVTSGQVGFGGTIAAASNCNQSGVLTAVAGCLVINVAGTTHYVPYF